jgi:condensin complex subunit 3
MSSMPDEAEIARDLWDSMSMVLLPRLKDKAPTVRLWAVKAMKRLQAPGDVKDPVMREFVRLMSTDSSKDIREAAVANIFINKFSLPHMLERIKDIRPEVRVAAYTSLTKTADIRHLKNFMRAQVVQFGLRDRDEEVKKAAIQLVLKWLHGLEYSVPKLLHLFNLVEYEEEAEIVGLTIINEMENGTNLSNKVKKQIQEHIPDWEGGSK